MTGEEIGALFKSSIKRDERYPTKLKARAGRATVVAYKALDGDVSSGQGAEFLADLVKTHYGLQGLQATGKLSATMWATRKARRPLPFLQLEPEPLYGSKDDGQR